MVATLIEKTYTQLDLEKITAHWLRLLNAHIEQLSTLEEDCLKLKYLNNDLKAWNVELSKAISEGWSWDQLDRHFNRQSYDWELVKHES